MRVFECEDVSGRAKAVACAAFKWVRLDELGEYAFPAANHKIIAALRRAAGQGR